MREPPRYETAERLGLAPRSGFVQPFVPADALRAAPSARGLPQTLAPKHEHSTPLRDNLDAHLGAPFSGVCADPEF